MRANVADLRAVGSGRAHDARVSIDLAPREGVLTEINLVGCTVDEALTRAEKFLDQAMVSDARTLRFVHGYGTGRLRRALTSFLFAHPLVAHVAPAEEGRGGAGVTVVKLKD